DHADARVAVDVRVQRVHRVAARVEEDLRALREREAHADARAERRARIGLLEVIELREARRLVELRRLAIGRLDRVTRAGRDAAELLLADLARRRAVRRVLRV